MDDKDRLAFETQKLRRAAELAFGTGKRTGRPPQSKETPLSVIKHEVKSAVLEQRIQDYRKSGSSVEWIAKQVGLGRRTLERRIHEIDRRLESRMLARKIRHDRVMTYLAVRRLRSSCEESRPPIK